MGEIIKLAIVGSRTFDDYECLCKETTSRFRIEDIEYIVSGGARGADSLGARFARENGIQLLEFKADWKTYGKVAGFIRNHDIVKACTHCLAFWDGQSPGTKHGIDLCEQYGKVCIVVSVKVREVVRKKR